MLDKETFNSTMGYLIDRVLFRILTDIENQNDISEEESTKLNIFCKRMHDLEEVFKENEEVIIYLALSYYRPICTRFSSLFFFFKELYWSACSMLVQICIFKRAVGSFDGIFFAFIDFYLTSTNTLF